ncbi:MAG: TraR/DksA family transcriptional regulator [Bdellovibrionales bacterium]|nr:TraR/DksA family transcriptional regulator [Bdellovibrionales bacterium]
MRKRDLDKFKKLLLMERQGIMQHLAELEGASETQLSQGGGDSVDLASLEITQAAIQKLGNREKNLLRKIEYALDKIENGEYGVCERCGEKIAPARLEARPVAQYCIDCKTELESNERRYSDQEEADEEGWGEMERFEGGGGGGGGDAS